MSARRGSGGPRSSSSSASQGIRHVIPPLPMELLTPRGQVDELFEEGRRGSLHGSRSVTRDSDKMHTHVRGYTAPASLISARSSLPSARASRSSMPIALPPPTSPYYASLLSARSSHSRASKTARLHKNKWYIPTKMDLITLFDPNLNGRDIQFAYVKDPQQRPLTTGRLEGLLRDKGGSRKASGPPNIWDEKSAGRTGQNQPFDPKLHKYQLHRSYITEQLGPWLSGKRSTRAVPEVINSFRDVSATGMNSTARQAAIADVLEAVVDESCLYDRTWSNVSDRALWYFPRALITLRRWTDFVERVCNLHFVIEYSQEFSVGSVAEIFSSGVMELESDAQNSKAFTREELQRESALNAARIRAYLDFVVQNMAALARHPHTAFKLALEQPGGLVRAEAEEAVQDFQQLVKMSARSLPVSDPSVLLSIQRTTTNAQNHGIDICLSPQDRSALELMSAEVRGAFAKYWRSNSSPESLQHMADVLVGLSEADLHDGDAKRKRSEGFNDLIFACGAEHMPDIMAKEAYAIVSCASRPHPSDDAIVDSISRCAAVPRASLTVLHRYGNNVVVRVVHRSEERGVADSAAVVRNRIMDQAADASSPLRKERIVIGLGIRGGRWESIRLFVCSSAQDMKCEKDYLLNFVLPAVRARCRTRRINFSWCDMGDPFPEPGSGGGGVDILVKRLEALQLCGIMPPGGHVRPFAMHLVSERGGYFPEVHEGGEHATFLVERAATRKGLEWLADQPCRGLSTSQLEVLQAFLRSSADSETFFLWRDPEFMSDPRFVNSVPELLRHDFVEQDQALQQKVSAFKESIESVAGPQGRIVHYKPSFHHYETPKEATGGKYQHYINVNKRFWGEMRTRGYEVLNALRRSDRSEAGTLSKSEVHTVLVKLGLRKLVSDEEFAKLCAAYDRQRKGHIDYVALVNQFIHTGDVKLGGLVEFGLKAYACVWASIDAYYPQLAPSGSRMEQELNDQEVILDLHASTLVGTVHSHLLHVLEESVSPKQPHAIVVVGGEAGSGKTTLLAAFARHRISSPAAGAVLFFCVQPWHQMEDVIACLVAQLDQAVLRNTRNNGDVIGRETLARALSLHATYTEESCIIIVDGLKDRQSENLLISVVNAHNIEQNRKRVVLVLSTVSIEAKDTREVLAHSVLPLMPTERQELISARCAARGVKTSPLALANLCRKTAAGNPKYLCAAVAFLAKLEDSRTDVQSMSNLAETLEEIVGYNIIPFMEEVAGSTLRRVLDLVYHEECGVMLSELPALMEMDEDVVPSSSLLVSLCFDLRDLGIFSHTSDTQRLLISCAAVRKAVAEWLEYSQRPHTARRAQRHLNKQAAQQAQYHKVSPFQAKKSTFGETMLSPKFSLQESNSFGSAQSSPQSAAADNVTLDLENQRLSAIPSEYLTRDSARAVGTLNLGSNMLTFVSKNFVHFENLTWLNLSVNQFTKIPEEISSLTSLTELDMSENQITELLPTVAKDLTNLTVLRMGLNQISQLPSEIRGLHKLKELHLSGNKILSLDTTIRFLTALQVLDLSSNKLIEMPDILTLDQLRRLYLSSNRLTSLPSIERLAFLEDLDLESNDITSMPLMALSYENLRWLNVAGNRLVHLEGLVGCTNLTHLNASNNGLEEIPAESALAPNLRSLLLAGNRIKAIPSSLLVWTSLKTLDLSNNEIHELPRSISLLSSLVTLNISNNELETLPTELIDCKLIARVDLEGNPLRLEEVTVAAMHNKVGKLCALNGGSFTPLQPRLETMSPVSQTTPEKLGSGRSSNVSSPRSSQP